MTDLQHIEVVVLSGVQAARPVSAPGITTVINMNARAGLAQPSSWQQTVLGYFTAGKSYSSSLQSLQKFDETRACVHMGPCLRFLSSDCIPLLVRLASLQPRSRSSPSHHAYKCVGLRKKNLSGLAFMCRFCVHTRALCLRLP
ncbi:hypothetical protein ABBQ38_003556 [Trebouxia sp. C0009 RCD-2024]